MPSRRSYWLLAFAVLTLIAGVAWQSYTGRVKLRDDAINGCLRSQLDRAGLTELNRDVGVFATNASVARRADGDVKVADAYDKVVIRTQERTADLRRRLPPNLECEMAYPHPSLLPWAG